MKVAVMEVDTELITGRILGRGLNSLRVRFTLMIGTFCSIVAALVFYLLEAGSDFTHTLTTLGYIKLVASIAAASGFTYYMTGRLTRPIQNLKASTEAIASGDYSAVVTVDCNCEVGGLAESFRKMVARLNDNVSKINTLAYEDGVTGLPNRAVLSEIIDRNPDLKGHVLFIDLDRFKQVNDLYGHQVGDTLLQMAATRMMVDGLEITLDGMNRCLTPESVNLESAGCRLLFRFAGDEFVVLVTGSAGDKDVTDIAQQIIRSLAEPFVIGERQVQIGASVGIAVLGDEAVDAADTLKYADMAMYEAKSRGRGTYAFFDDQMRDRATDRCELERDFLHAIANDEIIVHYQPKINLASNSVEGYEALVRWAHPTRGLLYPGSFLDVVGTGDGLERIGRKVMSIVATDIPKLRASGISCRVAVNVCPTQFADDEFADRLTDYVKSLGVAPSNFELEVTEAVAMLDVEKARKHLLALKSAGFKLSIDDFGMGFSNLAQLSKLPYDSLKIDRSLISDIVTNHDSRIIVSAIVSMAHGLGHTVVAEGVETATQLEILRLLGCDTLQGYYLGIPVPFIDLIAEASRPTEPVAAVGF
ncbi:hypothetical protein C0V73_21980 [Rhizobium sp. TH135]|nr:hypothetical protein C0V73_21980 [Rhizobium sp. TH135]